MAKLSVEATPVGALFSAGFNASAAYHLYIVYEDDNGNEFVIRGGPTNDNPLDWGNITVFIGELQGSRDERIGVSPEFRGQRVLLSGQEATNAWNILIQHGQNIHNQNIDYVTFGMVGYTPGIAEITNSNSTVASLLEVIGIDINQNLPTPEFSTLLGFVGVETKFDFEFSISGSSGNDIIRGTNSSQIINGGLGFDQIYAKGGNDIIIVSEGNDYIDGGEGIDTLSFQNFSSVNIDAHLGIIPHVSAAISIEKFIGTSGNDTFQGSAGITIDGGSGNDTFIMDKGGYAFGGADNDLFYLDGYDQHFTTINGGEGYDRLVIQRSFTSYDMSTGNFTKLPWSWDHHVAVITDIEEVTFGWGSVSGTSGTDTMIGLNSAKAFGGSGDDFITMNSDGVYNVTEGYGGFGGYGGSGNDHLVSLGWDELYGEADNDHLVGNSKTRILDGGSGNDIIYSSAGSSSVVVIKTGTGDDEVHGNGSINNEVIYDFTWIVDPGFYGDGSHLISVKDMGDHFEVKTTQGTDKIFDIPAVYFKSHWGGGGYIQFAFQTGMNWTNPNLPPEGGTSSSSFMASPEYDEFSFMTFYPENSNGFIEEEINDPIFDGYHWRMIPIDGEYHIV